MKSSVRSIAMAILLLFAGGAFLSSCKILKGDPRKNCNHPKHGEYMMEQRAKNMRQQGL